MTTARNARTSVEVISTPAGVKTRLARSSVEVIYKYKPSIDIDIYLSAAKDLVVKKDLGGSISAEILVGPTTALNKRVNIGGSISAEITLGPVVVPTKVDIQGSLDVDISVLYKFFPPNDNFSGAIDIDLSSGSFSSPPLDTTNLTMEPGEPAGRYRSAWWKVTPTITGVYAVNTFGSMETAPSESELDTVLSVYTGSSVDSLTEIAYNDDSDLLYNDSWVSTSYIPEVTLAAGTTYYIRVTSYYPNDTGEYVLNVSKVITLDGVTAPAITLSSLTGAFTLTAIQEGAVARAILSAPVGGVWIPPVYNTQLPPRARYPSPVYSFILFEPLTGRIITEMDDCTNQSVNMKLRDASSASFQLSFYSPNNALISPLATGLLVMRNDLNIFSGLVGPTQGTIQGGSHTIQYTAEDYRGVLKRRVMFGADRIVKDGITDDAEALGWNMIDTVQKRENGSLGILRSDLGPIGQGGYFKVTPNDSVFQAIQTLSGSNTTFDWDISWQGGKLYYYVWAERGDIVSYPLDFGGSILEMSYTYAPENFGNVVSLQAAGGIRSYALSQFLDQAPRLELAVSDDSIKTQLQADARAQGLLTTSRDLIPTYNVKLSSAMWNPELLWLGDTATIDILAGRTDDVRVMEIALSIANGESISVTLGRPVPNVLQRVAGTYDRVGRAESAVAQKAKAFIQIEEPLSAAPGDFWTQEGAS